jgi:DEAD/DEAH box helicase domain-containing protein
MDPSSPPWKSPRGVSAVVDQWLASRYVKPCLALDERLAASPAKVSPFPARLAEPLRAALEKKGITELYSHQAQAFEAALDGRHVGISTPTASGKSLCFHLPVLQAIIDDPDARAIYVFPTKALSRDQEASLRGFLGDAGLAFPAIVYDGDTPGDVRRAARERVPLLLTNPDMLHSGILPHHAHWARTFQHLRYVVLDEVHTYKGVFGSHMANVIARLRRVAQFHGSKPQFLCASATIGNTREHVAKLIGVPPEEVTLVDESGAPRGERRFFVFNPPVVNEELGLRASYLKSAVNLAADLVRAKIPTIIFGPSRNSVEIALKYLREKCADVVPDSAIMAYRGGYLPETRRAIEASLRNGEIRAVVATNALELGIDIGDLDAVICLGWPGSVAALWQRFGRAGRRNADSIAVMVASSAPLDQYLARTPEYLLAKRPEEARIDPANLEILIPHLKCAAFELPFVKGETFSALGAEGTGEALEYLAHHGVLHTAGDRFHWASDAYPANHVSLRSTAWDNFVIVDVGRGKNIAELDWRATHTMLHEQAIYQHDGEQYQVEKLDFENHKAFVRAVDPDFYTEAMTNRSVTVLEEMASDELPHRAGHLRTHKAIRGWGDVSVVEKVVGFKKIKFHTHENTGYGEVHLPDMQMHTTSFWLTIPDPLLRELGIARAQAVDALRGVNVALETVATIALSCDPRDINHTLGDKSGDTPEKRAGEGPIDGFDPTLFLFDAYPGGVGLAVRMYERADELLNDARELLAGCSCEKGCPACVGPGDIIGSGRKAIALRILDSIGIDGRRPALAK